MCSLRFENNLLTIESVRFASISKKTPLSKLSFAFVSLALPLLKRIKNLGIDYRKRELEKSLGYVIVVLSILRVGSFM
jgi:hypothetical protein